MKKIIVVVLYIAIFVLAVRCNSPTDVCTPFNFSEELLEEDPVISTLVDEGFVMTAPVRQHDTYEGVSLISFSYVNEESDEEVVVTLILLNDLRYNHNEMASEAKIYTEEMIEDVSMISADIIYEEEEDSKAELIVKDGERNYGYYGEYNLYYTIGIQYDGVIQIDKVRSAVIEYIHNITDDYEESLNKAKEGTSCD